MEKKNIPKLCIHITPYTAMCIYKFLSEFEPEMNSEPLMVSFKNCYEEYSKELLGKISKEQMEEAIMQTRINQMLHRDPPSKDFMKGNY